MRILRQRSFSSLLVSLTALLVLAPLFQGRWLGEIALDSFFSLVLLSALLALEDDRRRIVVGLGLLLPAIALRWADRLRSDDILLAWSLLFSTAFLVYVGVAILRAILTARQVTNDTIYGAICFYLLLGVFWASLFAIVSLFDPGALSARSGVLGARDYSDILYFALVTLTTLGYGDVVPASPLTRSMAVLDAMSGQLYIAILVARLVALHIVHQRRDGD
jgi:voltage-gated potassium channel Kch